METIREETRAGTDLGRLVVIVDASNLAFGAAHTDRKPRLKSLVHVIDEFSRRSIEHVVIADASLRHRIDEPAAYEALVRAKSILQAPAGVSADRFIVLLAQKRRAEGWEVLILTNDRMADHLPVAASRMTFLVIGDLEILFDPPLESLDKGSATSPGSATDPKGGEPVVPLASEQRYRDVFSPGGGFLARGGLPGPGVH